MKHTIPFACVLFAGVLLAGLGSPTRDLAFAADGETTEPAPKKSAKPADYKPAPGFPHGLPKGADCNRCHGKEDFNAIHAEQVHQDGSFPLEGEHGQLACIQCHDPKIGFMNLTTECASCHKVRDAHRRLVGDDCGACHDPRGWVPNRFRHTQTGFSLTGAHRGASCEQCHAIGFPVVPTDCIYCHEAEFRREADEHEIGDALNCDLCHDTHGWEHVRHPHK